MTEIAASAEIQEVTADFRTIFEREFSYVWNTLRRLGVRQVDLQDQMQEVFVVVHSILPTFETHRPLRPWLFGIAWRSAARYRSSARIRREIIVDDLDPPDDEGTTVEDDLTTTDRQRLFLRALARVDESRRPVFLMMEIDGFAAKDVAEVLGIPLNTVYSRLRLAREEFTKAALLLRSQRGRHGG